MSTLCVEAQEIISGNWVTVERDIPDNYLEMGMFERVEMFNTLSREAANELVATYTVHSHTVTWSVTNG